MKSNELEHLSVIRQVLKPATQPMEKWAKRGTIEGIQQGITELYKADHPNWSRIVSILMGVNKGKEEIPNT